MLRTIYEGSHWEKPFDHFLPWNMTPEHRAEFSLKKPHDPPN